MSTEVKTYGVMHFNIDCDAFVAPKREFNTAEEFITRAVDYEDAGYDLFPERDNAIEKLLPLVVSDGYYIVHRCSYHPTDYDLNDWWELVTFSGRGHIPIWYIDMEKVLR